MRRALIAVGIILAVLFVVLALYSGFSLKSQIESGTEIIVLEDQNPKEFSYSFDIPEGVDKKDILGTKVYIEKTHSYSIPLFGEVEDTYETSVFINGGGFGTFSESGPNYINYYTSQELFDKGNVVYIETYSSVDYLKVSIFIKE